MPVLRRKSDLFTFWNFFLAGGFIFSGMSGLNAATLPHHLPELSTSSYQAHCLGTVVFYTVAILTYYYVKFPRKLAGRTFLTWPDLTSAITPFVSIPLMVLSLGVLFPVQIPLVSQLLVFFGLSAPTVVMGMLVMAWSRNRSNIFLLALIIICAPIAVGISISGGYSRRYLISCLATIPIGIYWAWLRYKPTPTILTVIGATLLAAIPVVAGFSAVRAMLRDDSLSAIQRAQTALKALPDAIKKGGSTEGFMGQDSVDCSLGVIQLLNDGSRRLEGSTLHSLRFVITNPIPRVWWPDKPTSPGATLASDFELKGVNANLGINVSGQCYYDGGLWVHVLYGFLMAVSLRYLDELLVRRPGNPLLIAGLCGVSSHLMGWPRGCLGVMGMQILQVLVFIFLARLAIGLIFGFKMRYPRTDHIVDYPVLRSPEDGERWMGSYTAVQPTARRYHPAMDD